MRVVLAIVAVVAGGCHSSGGSGPDLGVSVGADLSGVAEGCGAWPQWGQSAGHWGDVCVPGQAPNRVIASLKVDPFLVEESAPYGGALLVHYQAPLVIDDDVYVLQKSGSWTPNCLGPDGGPEVACFSWDTQEWNEVHLRWSNGSLVKDWSYDSDWKPVPLELAIDEPLFQPVIVGGFIYVPGAGGTVWKLDRKTGSALGRLSPFGSGTPNPDTYVAGPLVADARGDVWYSAIQLDHDRPVSRDASGWLVEIRPDDSVKSVGYGSLVTGAPTGKSCHSTFGAMASPPPLPWPPADVAGQPVLPPLVQCGSQRPGINTAPAIAPDGTVFVVSRSHFTSRDSFVVAVNPDLTTKWAASLRGALSDGCGVMIPKDGDPNSAPYDCAPGARDGVEPGTNQAPDGRVIDESSSSPVALPDGSVLYGAYTAYNGVRGHTIKLDAGGAVVASYDFGWDYTPAIWQHGGTYSIIVKDNHYNSNAMGQDIGPYYVTQLDPGLKVEWQFQNTNTMSCGPGDGGISCVMDHPSGFEWCINAPAVDGDGTIYATGEDGVVYAIGQGGVMKGKLFLDRALGAAYTPVAIDHAGRIYTQNDSTLFVVGN